MCPKWQLVRCRFGAHMWSSEAATGMVHGGCMARHGLGGRNRDPLSEVGAWTVVSPPGRRNAQPVSPDRTLPW